MNKKIILVILLVLTMLFTLVACEENPDFQHQHSFEDKWTYDGTNHWHKATCEHTDEADGKAPHNFVAVPGDTTRLECDVCGCSKSNPNPKPEPPHEHTYKTEYTANEYAHWLETTCGHEVENAAPHGFVDGVCATCGWWSSATDVLFANLSKSDIWNYSILLDNVRVSGVNLLSEGLEHAELVVSGELQLSIDPDGQISGNGYIEADGQTYKAVISAGVVYACGDGKYFRCAIDEILAQNGVDVNAYLDELNAKTQEIREYVKQINDGIPTLPIDGTVIVELLSGSIVTDVVKSTDELDAYVVNATVLRHLNQTLATLTVEQYGNTFLRGFQDTPLGVLLGDEFDALPDKVYSLLSNTIFQTTTELWAEGFRLDDLFNQINGLIAQYYPDGEVNTIDDLVVALGIDLSEIAKQYGLNLNGVTVKQLVEACILFSPETLWNAMQKDESAKINAEQVADKLTASIDEYGDKTIYGIVAMHTGLTADYVEALVDGVADLLEDCIAIEFYIDADGVLQQVSLSVKDSDTTYEQEEVEQLKQLLANIGGTISLKRNHEIDQDLTEVIDQVNSYYASLDNAA